MRGGVVVLMWVSSRSTSRKCGEYPNVEEEFLEALLKVKGKRGKGLTR